MSNVYLLDITIVVLILQKLQPLLHVQLRILTYSNKDEIAARQTWKILIQVRSFHALLSFDIHTVIPLVTEKSYQLIATVAKMAHFIDVMMATYVSTETRIKVFPLLTYIYLIFFIEAKVQNKIK